MKLNITIDGKTYEVEVEAVEPETPAHLRSWTASPGAKVRVPAAPIPGQTGGAHAGNHKSVDESKVCRSPVSGIVIKVAVQVGQSLQPGDVLLVLEAMKMETNITAPAAGKIAAIPVSEGESVQAGQVVVEFEG